MSTTIIPTNVQAFNNTTDSKIFSLESNDKGVHRLILDVFVSADSLDELFSAIRAGVEMMDAEKVIGDRP